eukprot:7319872-Prymnesium_polylepis.1
MNEIEVTNQRERRSMAMMYGVRMHVSPTGKARTVGWRRTDAARLLQWAQADAAGLCPLKTPCQMEGPVPRYAGLRFALPTETTCDRPSATA